MQPKSLRRPTSECTARHILLAYCLTGSCSAQIPCKFHAHTRHTKRTTYFSGARGFLLHVNGLLASPLFTHPFHTQFTPDAYTTSQERRDILLHVNRLLESHPQFGAPMADDDDLLRKVRALSSSLYSVYHAANACGHTSIAHGCEPVRVRGGSALLDDPATDPRPRHYRLPTGWGVRMARTCTSITTNNITTTTTAAAAQQPPNRPPLHLPSPLLLLQRGRRGAQRTSHSGHGEKRGRPHSVQ